MISFQVKILAQLEEAARREGCELVHVSEFGNTGEVLAQVKKPAFGGPIQTVARAAYHFQAGHNKIQFNGEPMGPTDMSALFAEHEDAKINAMLRKWGQLLREGKK